MLLISKTNSNKKTCFLSLDEFDEETNHIKFQKLEILNQKITKWKIFLYHLASCLYSLDLKFLALGVGHMCI
jgi:hypothetical protein